MVKATVQLDDGEVVSFTARSVIQAADFVAKNYYDHAVQIDIKQMDDTTEGGDA